MKKRLLIVLFSLFVLVPLGLLSSSPAWAEWNNAYYKKILGFIPKGIANSGGINTPLGDYGISGINSVVGYYISALVGIAILFFIYFILMKILKRRGRNE